MDATTTDAAAAPTYTQPRMLSSGEKASGRKKKKKRRQGRGREWREVERLREREGGREDFMCVCEEGQKLHAEVTDDLSQSLQLFVESHGLQLGSPDSRYEARRRCINTLFCSTHT